MNDSSEPVRIKLYSADYALGEENLNQITKEIWREIRERSKGRGTLVRDQDLPEGAKIAVAGIAATVAIEYVVGKSVRYLIDVLIETLRKKMQEKHIKGNVGAKIQVGRKVVDITPHMRRADIDAQLNRLPARNGRFREPGRRIALVVGNTQYVDSKLTQLNAPQADALELASVLEDSSIGGFDAVDVLLNEPAAKVKQSIELLFRDKTKDDLLLLYFSGHGIKDESARLYLTTTDTRPDFVRSTGISAGFLKESMQGSNSQRKVLVLDCCYSGAFVQGAKASAAIGSRIYSGSEFLSGGYGQVVITSSDTMEYAWEGDKVIGSTDNSYFTHYLIEGLRTGQADDDKDGLISLTELYEYAYRHVINKQTPSMSASEMKGQIFLARNPRPVVRPDALPPELLSSLKSTHTWQKEGAILELGRFLGSSDTTAANTARHYLRQLARDDSRKVSDSAQRVLARYEGNTRLSDQERPPERSMSPKASARNVQSNVGSPRLEQPLGSTKDQAGNTSGMGNISVVPNEIKRKWNWGAFLLSWIWGMGNGTWIAMFVFVPYVGWIMPFLLGLKGNEWAWKNKQWDNIEHFQSVQKKWRKWSFIVYAVATVMFMCFLLFAGSM